MMAAFPKGYSAAVDCNLFVLLVSAVMIHSSLNRIGSPFKIDSKYNFNRKDENAILYVWELRHDGLILIKAHLWIFDQSC